MAAWHQWESRYFLWPSRLCSFLHIQTAQHSTMLMQRVGLTHFQTSEVSSGMAEGEAAFEKSNLWRKTKEYERVILIESIRTSDSFDSWYFSKRSEGRRALGTLRREAWASTNSTRAQHSLLRQEIRPLVSRRSCHLGDRLGRRRSMHHRVQAGDEKWVRRFLHRFLHSSRFKRFREKNTHQEIFKKTFPDISVIFYFRLYPRYWLPIWNRFSVRELNLRCFRSKTVGKCFKYDITVVTMKTIPLKIFQMKRTCRWNEWNRFFVSFVLSFFL